MSWARRGLATLALLIVIVVSLGCEPSTLLFTFDNRTDVVLCYYPSANDAAGADCSPEVEPGAETRYERLCGGDASRPITSIIGVKQGGEQIYSRTATCGEWLDTDLRLVIEQEGDEFIVTDSLPDSIPSP